MFMEKKKDKKITKSALLKYDLALASSYISLVEEQMRFRINDYRPYHFE